MDRGGLVVGLGLLPPDAGAIHTNILITKEIRVVGSFRFDREMIEVLGALADETLIADPVVTEEVPVRFAVEAFALAADPARSCKVLLDFGEAVDD